MTTTSASTSSLTSQKDMFLSLMLTQLKTQTPTDPVDSTTFLNQLAQYSGIEQQINTNEKLDSILTSLTSGSMSPVSYLGTTVDYEGDTVPVQDGKASWSYSSEGAEKVTVEVTDESGNVVYSGDGDASSGTHQFGLTTDAEDNVPDGTQLTIKVTATDADGKSVTTTILGRAKVDAVDSSSGTTKLEASGFSFDLSDVKRIATSTETTSS